MSLRIRLKRMGAKKRPLYRIIVNDIANRKDGKVLDQIGIYCPIYKEDQIRIDKEKFKSWVAKGASPSNTVKNLLKKVD